MAAEPQRDYYRPERAALVLATIWEWPAPLRHGSVVLGAWMLRQKGIHLITGLMGGELCRGLVLLRDELALDGVVSRLREMLERSGEPLESEPSAGRIVASWLGKTRGKTPLAAWLRQEASRSDDFPRQRSMTAD